MHQGFYDMTATKTRFPTPHYQYHFYLTCTALTESSHSGVSNAVQCNAMINTIILYDPCGVNKSRDGHAMGSSIQSHL